MNFLKRQLKKTNRGFVLALVLIIGVTIYTIIDNNNFKEEKPEIEKIITSYIEEMGEFTVTPEELASKKEISDDEFKPYQEEFNEFINKYWIYKKRNPNAAYYGSLMSDAKDNYFFMQSCSVNDYVSSATYEARDITVRKAGPNCATASFKLYIVVETVGAPSILTPHYPESVEWFTSDDLEGKAKKFKLEGEYDVTLERTSDGWKIYEAGGYINSIEEIDIAE